MKLLPTLAVPYSTIYFVVHGQITEGPDDTTRPLSEKGADQIVKLSHKLSDTNFNLAIISPTIQTKQTVGIILQRHEKCPPIVKADELGFPKGQRWCEPEDHEKKS